MLRRAIFQLQIAPHFCTAAAHNFETWLLTSATFHRFYFIQISRLQWRRGTDIFTPHFHPVKEQPSFQTPQTYQGIILQTPALPYWRFCVRHWSRPRRSDFRWTFPKFAPIWPKHGCYQSKSCSQSKSGPRHRSQGIEDQKWKLGDRKFKPQRQKWRPHPEICGRAEAT